MQGRFTSIDPGTFTPADPQNWNRYSYVQNNPLKFIDPQGTDLFLKGNDADYIVTELERITGLKLVRDTNSGKVTIETWQIYGMDGELLAEYAASGAPASPQKEYGYRNGQLIVTATVPITSGTGLQGQYFDNMNFTDLKVTRTDATVDFDWGLGTPDSSLGVDTFTVRWQGRVEPQYSQTYTFYTHSDDGVRLWVNGQLLIDKWIDQGPTEWSGQIALTAGQRYDIVMEFYENGGGAMAKLWWSSASQPKQIIPQSRLYPPGSSSQVAVEWLVADQLGTPRIILDKTGSLATTKRRDYLPFGEELFAGVGGRTIALGYTSVGIRQQFTSKERDNETGLDYFLARYYSSTQGRFTSADSFGGSEHNPQTLNRYAYVQNDPLNFMDPSGHTAEDWMVNPLEYLFGERNTDPMLAQDPQQKPLPPTTEGGPLGTPIQNPCIYGSPGCKAVDLGTVEVRDPQIIPGRPNDSPGETTLERYVTTPVQTALEVADWASKGFRNFGYAILPDYAYLNGGIPLVASGGLQFSKDKHLYLTFAGPTAGAKNFTLGWQAGVAYFATFEMTPRERDSTILGPGTNLSTPYTPFGAYIPDSGIPAVTLGGPFSAGGNRSRTWKLF